ncbi:PRTRC system protein B [Barnesiella viscericola]|uniref:PRTRC system protein B n=1 Tax=Barnesiella viscericola TaxID=397865 RepID=UPI0023534633|nr:PRTRC system protein B [Barnesiella viscericola]
METNKITRNLTALLYPMAALIAYKNTEWNRDSFFLELRTIDESGNFCEEQPVSFEFMNELLKGYSESHSTTPYGPLPDNLLFSDCRKGSERYVWYNPPCRRMMFFKESLGIESAEYNIPGVVYDAGGHGMRIYAYIDKKITPETPLYAAPFFNVTGANVCLGNAKIDKPKTLTYSRLLEYWEKKFWLTEFSHLGGGSNPTKSNLVLVTKAAMNKPFNFNELKPINKLKLKDILR